MSKPPLVIGILGPTGVGKTSVAIELARLLGVRIISCDSMQVYRGFPVLTNQPTAEERTAARHELVGFVDPRLAFSAAEYAEVARPLIREDLSRCGRALVVGGTGLYMRAALAPLAVHTQGDPALRQHLEARAAVEGPAVLHAELAALDPEAAERIDPRNLRRVIRALEAIYLTGQKWSGRSDLWSPDYYYPSVIVGLVHERGALYERINARAARIVLEGGVEEVARFRREYGENDTRPGRPGICSAIGYEDIVRYLEGSQTLDQTIANVASATRKYARRQWTWLRKVKGAVIIDVTGKAPAEVAAMIADLRPAEGA
ncbi:MAG: tRNA (adenosine(37)-N6)-dimethylallyltransferase MiaA [Thermoleophilia bacterium]|nr:tRNA (adenosine(37)-N6)-dimethylallyltransferase MiaA [Thermoleophilia bacterium]